MALKPKTTKQTALEQEADCVEGLIAKGQRRLDRIRDEIQELESKRVRAA